MLKVDAKKKSRFLNFGSPRNFDANNRFLDKPFFHTEEKLFNLPDGIFHTGGKGQCAQDTNVNANVAAQPCAVALSAGNGTFPRNHCGATALAHAISPRSSKPASMAAFSFSPVSSSALRLLWLPSGTWLGVPGPRSAWKKRSWFAPMETFSDRALNLDGGDSPSPLAGVASNRTPRRAAKTDAPRFRAWAQ